MQIQATLVKGKGRIVFSHVKVRDLAPLRITLVLLSFLLVSRGRATHWPKLNMHTNLLSKFTKRVVSCLTSRPPCSGIVHHFPFDMLFLYTHIHTNRLVHTSKDRRVNSLFNSVFSPFVSFVLNHLTRIILQYHVMIIMQTSPSVCLLSQFYMYVIGMIQKLDTLLQVVIFGVQ